MLNVRIKTGKCMIWCHQNYQNCRPETRFSCRTTWCLAKRACSNEPSGCQNLQTPSTQLASNNLPDNSKQKLTSSYVSLVFRTAFTDL